METEPTPTSSPPPPPKKKTGCCLALVAVLVLVYVGGRMLGAHLQDRLLPTPEAKTLAEALAELAQATHLDEAERQEKLRQLLRRLVDTRKEQASDTERALLDEALTQLGSGDPEQKLRGTLERLKAARGEAASAEERQAFDALLGLAERTAAGGGPPAELPEPLPSEAFPAAAAEVGQWVLIQHELPGQEGPPRFTYKQITQVEGETITIRSQELEGEEKRKVGEPFDTFATITPLALPVEPSWEQVELGDRSVRCFKLERKDRKGRRVLTWTSYELPVHFGLYVFVRQVVEARSGTPVEVHELVQYGDEGGPR